MIEAENLCKTYKVKTSGNLFRKSKYAQNEAVKNINFSIKQGEMLAYLGVNGAGKSTTIKMLTGILVPSSGTITVFNKNPYKNRKKIAKDIGVVFGQRSQLIWDLPVIDSYRLFSKIYDITKDEFEKRLDYIYEVLGIEHLMEVPVRKLSLGQRMCCEIAIATIHNPKLLVLDEPTIGLDIFNKDKIRSFIVNLNQQYHTTVFLTTHDLGDVESVCKKIILLNKGEMIYEGTIDMLKEQHGKNNKIKLSFDSIEKMQAVNLAGLDFKENFEDTSITISYDKEKHSANEMIRYLSQNCSDVKDIAIMQTDLEEIIKNIH